MQLALTVHLVCLWRLSCQRNSPLQRSTPPSGRSRGRWSRHPSLRETESDRATERQNSLGSRRDPRPGATKSLCRLGSRRRPCPCNGGLRSAPLHSPLPELSELSQLSLQKVLRGAAGLPAGLKGRGCRHSPCPARRSSTGPCRWELSGLRDCSPSLISVTEGTAAILGPERDWLCG